MQVHTSEQGSTMVFHVVGKIVGYHIVDLCKQLESFRNGGFKRVVVDLSGVDEIDSCGLGGLLYSCRILEKNDLRLVLACPQPHIASLFHDCNFDNAVEVADSY